tara:strand:- start:23 stop:544 length:522 start_codon:yes stop_codon:yes gene_type:complete
VVAEDISDFQIEGISVGDSALDFFTEEHIKENEWQYDNKKYKRVQNDELSFFQIYDAVDFHYKTGDKNYIIHNISGILFYDDNIEVCYGKMDSIVDDLSKVFPNAEKSTKETYKLLDDESDKSKFTEVNFKLKSGYVVVSCFDYSEEYGGQDHLSIGLDTPEINEWLQYDAFQ